MHAQIKNEALAPSMATRVFAARAASMAKPFASLQRCATRNEIFSARARAAEQPGTVRRQKKRIKSPVRLDPEAIYAARAESVAAAMRSQSTHTAAFGFPGNGEMNDHDD